MIAIVDKDRQRALFFSDIVGLILVSGIVFQLPPRTQSWSWPTALLIVGMAILWSLSLRYAGAYEYLGGRRAELLAIVKGGLLFTALMVAIEPLHGQPFPHIPLIIGLSTAGSVLSRKALGPVLLRLAGHSHRIRILIIGGGAAGKRLQEFLGGEQLYQFYCVDGQADQASGQPDSRDPLTRVFEEYRPHGVILTLNGDTGTRLEPILRLCNEKKIPWKVVPSVGHLDATDLRSQVVGGVPLIGLKTSAFTGMNLRVKQALDLILASFLMIPGIPIMAVIWVLIRLDSPGPGLIRQARVGYKGKIFHIYKFRTMFVNSDDSQHREYVKEWYAGRSYNGGGDKGCSDTFKIVADKRVTRIGRFLRRYSLDELPQILNVLKLEMSLVGPRPSLSYELEHYQNWHLERLEAPPGVTGVWQVAARNRTTFNEMAKLDIDYLRNWSPARDFRILLKTIPAVFRGTGH